MLKKLCVLLAVLLVPLSLFTSYLQADQKLTLTINQQQLQQNAFVAPDSQVVFVPAKVTLNALKIPYVWVNKPPSIKMKTGTLSFTFFLNENTLGLNEKSVKVDAAPRLINNTLYLPAQTLSELLAARYAYDPVNRKVSLSTSSQPAFMDQTLGNKLNDQLSGAWWGENITKMARSKTKTFTYALDSSTGQRKAYLFERFQNKDWTEGESFAFSRAPNILIDPSERVHLIGCEPFDSTDEGAIRIVDISFNEPNTIKGAFSKTYLTTADPRREEVTADNYGTYFCGAAMGTDGTILVAYNNSISGKFPNDQLGVRIWSPKTAKWEFETIRDHMPSRYCYPFAFVSKAYLHVLAIEDHYDPEFGQLTPPYNGYLFRYGVVKHYQRPQEGGPWVETTLIDFSNTPGISKQSIAEAMLRTVDFTVEATGKVHAVLKYSGTFDGKSLTPSKGSQMYHYWKDESAKTWNNEPVTFPNSNGWIKFWERPDHSLYFYTINKQKLMLMPLDQSKVYDLVQLNLATSDMDPTPFSANARSGSRLTESLDCVVYSGKNVAKAHTYSLVVGTKDPLPFDFIRPLEVEGTVSLPGNQVAPKGGVQVLICASPLNPTLQSAIEKVLIPEGENSAPYRLTVDGTMRYRLWYDCQQAEGLGSLRWGVLKQGQWLVDIGQGDLIDFTVFKGPIHIYIQPR